MITTTIDEVMTTTTIYIDRGLQFELEKNCFNFDFNKSKGIIEIQSGVVEKDGITSIIYENNGKQWIFYLKQNPPEYQSAAKYKLCVFQDPYGNVQGPINDLKYIISQKEKKERKGDEELYKNENADIEFFLDNVIIDDKFINPNISKRLGVKSFIKHFAYTFYITLFQEYIDNPPVRSKEKGIVKKILEKNFKIEIEGKPYYIMHTSLFYSDEDVYAIFELIDKKVKLINLQTKGKSLFCSSAKLNIDEIDLPKILNPFTELKHYAFDSDKYLNKFYISEHAIKDHDERKKELYEKKDLALKDKGKIIEDTISESIVKSKNDPFYARSVIYIDGRDLYRSFLLPLGYNLVAVIRTFRVKDIMQKLSVKLKDSDFPALELLDSPVVDKYNVVTLLTEEMALDLTKHFYRSDNPWIKMHNERN